jgi:hypothetical protein
MNYRGVGVSPAWLLDSPQSGQDARSPLKRLHASVSPAKRVVNQMRGQDARSPLERRDAAPTFATP